MITYKVTVGDEGTKWYNSKDELHRVSGPAVEYSDGTKVWYKEDKRHREDGPAIEDVNGNKHWFKEGKEHRLDGPAIERANGTKKWWLEGNLYTEAEYNNKLHAPSCEGKVVEIDGKKYKLTAL